MEMYGEGINHYPGRTDTQQQQSAGTDHMYCYCSPTTTLQSPQEDCLADPIRLYIASIKPGEILPFSISSLVFLYIYIKCSQMKRSFTFQFGFAKLKVHCISVTGNRQMTF